MPKIDLSALTPRTGSTYPEEYRAPVIGRQTLRVGDAGGLTQFGANIVTLPPGVAASLRHWHVTEDEFLIVLSGELTLVEDEVATPMRPGDCAAFPANVPNGHHMVNRSDRDGSFLVVGSRNPNETAYYSDIDLMIQLTGGEGKFMRKDGSPYAPPAED